MQIIFDEKEYILPLVTGSNPKFTFDEIITQEMKYEEMEDKYVQISLYWLPASFDLYQYSQKDQLLKNAQIYSSYKVDLLTIAVGPENHDMVLLDPKKRGMHIGRISYTITCKHIDDINIKIKKAKIQMGHLMQNEIALKFKYRNEKCNVETQYTKGLYANLIKESEKTEYEYEDKNTADNSKNGLIVNTVSSMFDLRNADSSINIYTFRLIDCSDAVERNKDFFEKNPGFRTDSNRDIKLINHYSMIGYSTVNFVAILSENDEAILRQSSQFFRQVSGFNKKKTNEENQPQQEFSFQISQNLEQVYKEPIYYNGVKVGDCEIEIAITNIPLIRQIMFGVMTENGFEINSIHLYDNIISDPNSNSLPADLQLLAKQKIELDNELIKQKQIQSASTGEFNLALLKILNAVKATLSKSIEDNCLYYGYSTNEDLYTGQKIMLDLGITLIDVLDKLNLEQRTSIFQILKIINERSEFDLGTIYTKWFSDKGQGKDKETSFLDQSILKNRLIENFFEFNYMCLAFALEALTRGKTLDPQSKLFSEFFLSVAFFRLPCFRKVFLEAVTKGIDKKVNFEPERTRVRKKESIEDYMEIDPINNLILWEDLFYSRIDLALKNCQTPNEIQEKRGKIQELIKILNPKSENNRSDWRDKISKRDFAFFSLVKNLYTYIINKVASADINWLNIPGFEVILNAIIHELSFREIKQYPKQLMDLLPLFINNVNVINEFIKQIVIRTNVFDVTGVFNLVSIIDSMFVSFSIKNPDIIFAKFDYNTLSQSMKTIIQIDHSLCVAKFLWLYYKDAHLMSINHLGEICQSVFISKFYNLFFHWSWQVRNLFYYFVLYIIGFRLKTKIPFKDMEDMKLVREYDIGYMREFAGNIQQSFGDILEGKFNLILKIREIVKKEHSDPTFNNIINPDKYRDTLKEIPQECHKNIVVSLHHFDTISKEFMDWEKTNKDKKEGEIEYPEIVLVTPKDIQLRVTKRLF